jgi:GNAT superfamily N-acetyltransferase
MIASLKMRPATVAERGELEALQWRASLMWEEYRDALLAHPDAIELPVEQIARTIVAELENNAVGFAVVLPREDGDAELDGLFVEPAMWRAGIGTRLIRASEILAAAEGADFLCVVGNPRAACGFELIGREATRFGAGLTMRKAIGGSGRGEG